MATVSKLVLKKPAVPARKRVAAYARVSMETDRLQHSLAAQVSHYSQLIQSHPDWTYVGVYADDGISGTKKTTRTEFMRMLADADAGKIDIILTKSLSRFARNTVDMLEIVRHLRDIGVEVRFEKEGINTFDSKGEMLLTLLSSFAQEEVRSISDNVKWGTRKRFEKGIPNGHFRMLGYHWEGNQLAITPEEAAIVRRIFHGYLTGKSRIELAKELNDDGIHSINGCLFQDSSIKAILTNITYTGNLLLQKEYIADPITKKRKKNKGELTQYFVENNHEAIITREEFDAVQAEMRRRKVLGPRGNKSLNLTCFSSIIKCPLCGKSYYRSARRNRNGTEGRYVVWICGYKKEGRPCDSKILPDTALRKTCCEVLGLSEFNDDVFTTMIDHIVVIGDDQLDFHFRDGHVVHQKWKSSAKKDCWTEERRAATGARVKRDQVNCNPTCFSSRIICELCNASLRKQRSTVKAGKIDTWRCNSSGFGCAHRGFRDDDIKTAVAGMMGLAQFDETAFRSQIDHLSVSPTRLLTAHFRDGHTATHQFPQKVKKPCWTPEHREHFMQSVQRRKEARLNAYGQNNPGKN